MAQPSRLLAKVIGVDGGAFRSDGHVIEINGRCHEWTTPPSELMTALIGHGGRVIKHAGRAIENDGRTIDADDRAIETDDRAVHRDDLCHRDRSVRHRN
jgi:hypothetical protein